MADEDVVLDGAEFQRMSDPEVKATLPKLRVLRALGRALPARWFAEAKVSRPR